MTTTTQKTAKIAALIAAVAMTGFAALPANAASNNTVKVTVDRTELATPDGAERVYATLKRAAEKACGVNEGRRPLSQIMASRECAEDMLEGFVRQVNSSRLSALNAQNRGSKAG